MLTGHAARCRRHVADRYLDRAREVGAARGVCSTGSSNSRKCSSTATAAACANAGFDAVIGNPPWDMIRADAGSADARERSRRDDRAGAPLHARRRRLHARSRTATPTATSSSSSARSRSRAPAAASAWCCRPASRPITAARRCGGGCSRACDVDALVGYRQPARRLSDPSQRPVSAADRDRRVGRPASSPAGSASDDPAALEAIGDEAPADSSVVSRAVTPASDSPHLGRRPGHSRSPRRATDLAIVERAAALFPPLGSDARAGRARFGRELNATRRSRAFRRARHGPAGRRGQAPRAVSRRARRARGRHRQARRRGGCSIRRRYERPRLAYRDVASADQPPDAHRRDPARRLRLDAHGLLPAHAAAARVAALPLRPVQQLRRQLPGRLRVTTHVTTATVERLPLPTRDHSPRAFREIAALARLLSRRDDAASATRLQVLVASLYQLTADEFAHVLSTFPLIPAEERDQAYVTYVATEAQRTRR